MTALALSSFLLHVVGCTTRHFNNLAKRILIRRAAFQTHCNFIRTDRLSYFQMNVSKALLRVSTPNELVACINFQRIAA